MPRSWGTVRNGTVSAAGGRRLPCRCGPAVTVSVMRSWPCSPGEPRGGFSRAGGPAGLNGTPPAFSGVLCFVPCKGVFFSSISLPALHHSAAFDCSPAAFALVLTFSLVRTSPEGALVRGSRRPADFHRIWCAHLQIRGLFAASQKLLRLSFSAFLIWTRCTDHCSP